jgi:ubiquinone/menaquinone biosynthesis C-methylase UbiE
MDTLTTKKWDSIAKIYDWSSFGAEIRWAPAKEKLYAQMGDGKILFLAVGTGVDFQHFPVGKDIVGIDISPKMLKKAAPRARRYQGRIELKEMDARELTFSDETFDQIFTSCTFCSVPDPVDALKELKRVLKPGGELKMFEHTASLHFPFRQLLNIMNPLTEKLGPSLNRHTVSNLKAAGFTIEQVSNIYLDIVKTIHAAKPQRVLPNMVDNPACPIARWAVC